MRTRFDFQRTVEEIQNALAAEGATPITALSEFAEDYAAACREINERLRESHDLLRKGLRSEAIQRAEVEPNLLEMAVVLDFPERAQWCEWLKHSGRPLPPELRIDAAAEINAAYAQEQPLAVLLGRHRLAALARAPLAERIGILRMIAEADANNPVWQEDLRTYEKHRHKQLQSEAEAAAKRNDIAVLERLEAELRYASWTVPPSGALVQWTMAATARLRLASAREELKTLEAGLTTAFADFDVGRGRSLRGRWQACAAIAELGPDDPLAQLAAPALEWLAEQDRQEESQASYDRAVAELERALDEGVGLEDLKRRCHELDRHERGTPELLERRCRERIASLELTASRRNKLWLTGIAGSVLVVAALAWFWMNRQLAEAQVAETSAVLARLIDDSNLTESRKYVEALTAERKWLRERAEVVEQEARLSGLETKERERTAAFRAAIEGAASAGLDRPDKTSLVEARRLARGPHEETEILDLERKVAARQRELQDQRNQAYLKRVEELRAKIRTHETDSPQAGEEALTDLRQLSEQAKELEHASSGVDRALIDGVTALRKRLSVLHDAEESRQDRERRLRDITAAVGNRRRYRERLAEYAKEFPDTKRSYDFLKVLEKEPASWEQLERWDAFVERFASADSALISPTEATARIAEATALLPAFAAATDATDFKQRIDFLTAIGRRVSQGERIDAPLKDIFQLQTVADLTMIEDKGGRKFYSVEKPELKNKHVAFKYLRDFKLTTGSTLINEEELAPDGIVAAPQSVAATRVLDELARLDDAHWEAAFCRMLIDVESQARMDPILKVQLLQQLLTVARQGSLVLEHAFARHAELIDGANLDGTVNWLDPADPEAARTRRQAEALLARLPNLAPARDAAAKEFAQLRKPWSSEPHRWIGWLRQSDDGQWHISTAPLNEKISGELFMIHPAEQGPVIQFARIGQISAGQPKLIEDVAAFVEGRPVYVRGNKQDGK